jgi:hypothetical protein
MQTRNSERNLSDIRTFTEALARAYHDSGKSIATIAEKCDVSRGYLTSALDVDRVDVLQFPARKLQKFCEATSPLPLAWLADQLGFVLVKRDHAESANNLAMETLDVQEKAGALAARVRCALADGKVDPHEAADIRDEARRVQREAAEVERAAAGMSVVPARRA